MKPMSLSTQPGAKIRYLGWTTVTDYFIKQEQEAAAAGLILGATYTLKHLDVGNSYSLLELVEFPNRYFNPLMFYNV